MNQRPVRVRFAPSPTGPLHIGGVRTALYNYFFAKKHGGTFILRIEDTDQNRFVPGAEEYIIKSLEWCGIHFDEGVHIGGPHAPYRQSDRKLLYRQYAEQLVNSGYAYYAFDGAEELEELRKKYEAEKKTFQYSPETRMALCNSLTLAPEVVKQKIENGEHYVIRVKIPENQEVHVNDLIRGHVVFQSSLLDDKVLFKSDGMPTYHLANVVDDYLMEVSHVIRGEEWLPSAPLHVLLYKYLGWENKMPQFAHLPLLLKPDGNGKLSKRDGDRLGFPVFPMQWVDPKSGELSSGYKESGYFADAFINMLALLGWNPGTEQEIFSIPEMTELFTIERVGKSGSKFDPEKAKWFNHQYLQQKGNNELAQIVAPYLKEQNIEINVEKLAEAISLVKERVNFAKEISNVHSYLFKAPANFDEKVIGKFWKENTPGILQEITNILKSTPANDHQNLHDAVVKYIQESNLGMGQVMNSLRLCLVGTNTGPDLFKLVEFLGVPEVCSRIEKAVSSIKI